MNEEKELPEKTLSKYRPSGAILITTFLTVVILVFWFGTYILNVLRG